MMSGIFYDRTGKGLRSDFELFSALEKINPRDNYSFASMRENRELDRAINYFTIHNGPKRPFSFVLIIINEKPIEMHHSDTPEGKATYEFMKKVCDGLGASAVEVIFVDDGRIAYVELAHSKEERESRNIHEEGRRFAEKYLTAA